MNVIRTFLFVHLFNIGTDCNSQFGDIYRSIDVNFYVENARSIVISFMDTTFSFWLIYFYIILEKIFSRINASQLSMYNYTVTINHSYNKKQVKDDIRSS